MFVATKFLNADVHDVDAKKSVRNSRVLVVSGTHCGSHNKRHTQMSLSLFPNTLHRTFDDVVPLIVQFNSKVLQLGRSAGATVCGN